MKRSRLSSIISLSLVASLLLPASSYAASTSMSASTAIVSYSSQKVYTPTQIGTLDAPYSTAYDLNDLGQVVGAVHNEPNAIDHISKAFIWEKGNIKALELPSGYTESDAKAINKKGVIVGSISSEANGKVACMWKDGVCTPLCDTSNSTAIDVNNSGTVLINHGYSASSIYKKGKLTQITLPNAKSVTTKAINESNQVFGTYDIDTSNYRSFIFSNGKAKDLGTLGGNTYAQSMNNKGAIVGESNINENVRHAFLYSNGKLIDLDKDNPDVESTANYISDTGIILGRRNNELGYWKNNKFVAIPKYERAYSMTSADSITSKGEVLCQYRLDNNGAQTGVVLYKDGKFTDLGVYDNCILTTKINSKNQILLNRYIRFSHGGNVAFFYSKKTN